LFTSCRCHGSCAQRRLATGAGEFTTPTPATCAAAAAAAALDAALPTAPPAAVRQFSSTCRRSPPAWPPQWFATSPSAGLFA
jgi:hypothetical protein